MKKVTYEEHVKELLKNKKVREEYEKLLSEYGLAIKKSPIQCRNETYPEKFPEDRLDAAFRVAGEAFKKTKLTVKDIDNAVKEFRKKAYRKSS